MSDRWASACRGKRHYNSEHRADEAAKASQVIYGIHLNSYLCDFCKKWHVGASFAAEGRKARMEQENEALDNCKQVEQTL